MRRIPRRFPPGVAGKEAAAADFRLRCRYAWSMAKRIKASAGSDAAATALNSVQLNEWYLNAMTTAPADTVLGRVRDLWWPEFLAEVNATNLYEVMNRLDSFMDKSRHKLLSLAETYGTANGGDVADKRAQLRNQFLKSNTGKMFERFVGLTIAHSLRQTRSAYGILPFTSKALKLCRGLSRSSLEVSMKLGTISMRTAVDADLFIFRPDQPDSHLYLVSIKSTLKDRFHNVPFWNLLRRCAISDDFPEITASNKLRLTNSHYVAICTDLAEEQPDFGSDDGPRNLLQMDAALLDGAYVTSARARGVSENDNCIGPLRTAPFHRLSSFIRRLAAERAAE